MSTQSSLNLQSQASGPVECLGQTFASDDARREHYLKLLADKLKDPEFRKIEGFPIGDDDDILALSDPPYYTACPNPWIGDFIKHYGRPYDTKEKYHREPFAADVTEGKNHPIYNAHAYHTKVPHRAIMRYILHFTEPGDIVCDCFCGTGMTGIAAQLCGDPNEVRQLGYRVDNDGTVHDESGRPFSRIGARLAILGDLSPAATFIANCYNKSFDAATFERQALKLLDKVEREWGWLYETNDGGTINYVVWSDVLLCPQCQNDVVFLEAAYDQGEGVAETFKCGSCGADLTKASASKRMELTPAFNGTLVSRIKRVPVLVDCKVGKKRFKREVDDFDKSLLSKIDLSDLPPEVPLFPFEKEKEQYKRDALHLRGIETAADFYTKRNLLALCALLRQVKAAGENGPLLRFWITSIEWLASLMYRFREGGGGGQQGKLTIPSLICEQNVFRLARGKIADIVKIGSSLPRSSVRPLISTCDAAALSSGLSGNVDYAFIDPPFGANLFYSDLNFIWESWHRVMTDDLKEAVMHRVQTVREKTLNEYSELMLDGFKNIESLLKPGRWVTVEFSNSQASVWNGIQTSMQQAGFVVANVAALDKKQRSFRSVTSTTAVKQDLVISAYKPNGGLEERFRKSGHTIEGVWDFMRTHLRNLPVVKPRGGELEFIAERDPRILHDRMVAFYIGHGVPVPLSSAEFQAGLAEKFPERDGMFFLSEQVAEWDKKRSQMQGVGQMSIFVEDEKSAINWIRQYLNKKPCAYNDIAPEFMQQLGASWKKFETRPELNLLLEQNFIKYDGKGEVPSQIHSYLSTQNKDLRNLPKNDARLQNRAKDRWYVPDPNKAVDVEKLRNKRLLQEFWDLCDQAGIARPKPGDANQPTLPIPTPVATKKTGRKKLKEVRSEAVRLGFKECFAAKDYATILAIAHHLPDNVIEEDEQLQMMHDMAVMRTEE